MAFEDLRPLSIQYRIELAHEHPPLGREIVPLDPSVGVVVSRLSNPRGSSRALDLSASSISNRDITGCELPSRRAYSPGWYGAGERTIEITSATAVWRHGGLPVVPIRDPLDRFAPQALLCIDQTHDPAQIVSWFVQLRQVEVTFQEARPHLGLETQRQWSNTKFPHFSLRHFTPKWTTLGQSSL